MVLQFKLLPEFQRPVISVDFDGITKTALIDTGALIPVFTEDAKTLEALGGKLEKRNVTFGGFGGNVGSDLYRLDFKLGNMSFAALPIMCAPNPNMPFSFVFSASMFCDFAYTIDNIKHKLIVDTKDVLASSNLRYKTKSGAWLVLSNS